MRSYAAPALVLVLLAQSSAIAQDPRQQLDAAIAAMGGSQALADLYPIRIEAVGHGYALEQSERPEGPWLVAYRQREETRDASRRRLVRQIQTRSWSFPAWSPATSLVVEDGVAARRAGDRWMPGLPMDVSGADDAFDLAPERLLLTARDARDLRTAANSTLHGVANHAVAFTWRGKALTLHLNAHTHLPTMLEIAGDDDRFGVWGDVVERRWYSFWALEPGGVWYPRQTTVEWNGQPFSDETVLSFTPRATDAAFPAIPDDIRAAFSKGPAGPAGLASLRLDASKAMDVAEHVVMLPGNWNVVLVRQPDGIAVIEAPISSAYSAEVIAYAEARFPGQHVKALVTTSDAWPHIGGVREYLARGVPVYRLDLNAGILERLASARRVTTPDALARQPRTPRWHTVSGRTAIGSGPSRIELLPVRGELGERMLHAWLPGAKLLYASDMIQRTRSGEFFWVGLLAEVESVVRREGLTDIERAMAMHQTPIAWTEVTAAVAALRRNDRSQPIAGRSPD